MLAFLQTTFPHLDTHLFLQTCGVLGFLAYIGAFAALQFGKIDGNGIPYALLNVIGATLVLISLASAFNLASLLIQVSWIVIGTCGIFRCKRRARPHGVFLRNRG